LGALALNNADGRYDTLLGQRIFAGQEVRIYKGDEDDTYSAFTLWLKGLIEEPIAGVDRLTLSIVSLARRLFGAALTSVFSTTTYPSMDANIAGLPIPKIWGTVISAQAFRINTGRWKVAGHPVVSISAARKADGTVVTILTTDLTLGEFTVTAAVDSESRLFVDCRGKDKDKPGTQIRDVAEDFGITTIEIDTAALTQVDVDRAVDLGFQVLGGSVADVLTLIAGSAFLDWLVTRDNLLSARVRKRDLGNLVSNSGFEIDTSGWLGLGGATIARTTAYKFRGSASLEITKPAPNTLARAASSGLSLVTSRTYTVTLLAAVISGTTAAFRFGLSDGTTDFLSGAVTLSSSVWTRLTHLVTADLLQTLLFDSTIIFFDSTTVFFDNVGGAVVIYPEHLGGGAVTVVVDEVEVVEVINLDDANARYEGAEIRSPTLWRVRAGYQFDGRTGVRRFVEKTSAMTQQLIPSAESREMFGVLRASTDANTVAQAVLDHFTVGRIRVTHTLLDPRGEPRISLGTVVKIGTSRLPELAGETSLFRVVAFSEEYPEVGVPRMRIEAEAESEALFKPEAITIT